MVQRISGFASGMDIDDMVKKIMQAQRAPLDKLKQKQQTVQWQRENFRDVNLKIVEFRNKVYDNTLTKSFNGQKTIVSGDTTAVTAKGVSDSVSGTITIKVNELATAASIKSSSPLAPYPSSTKLSDISSSIGSSIEINNSVIDIDLEKDTIGSVINKINQNADAKVTAFYDETSGQFSLVSKTTGKINGDGEIAIAGNLLQNVFKLDSYTAGTDAQLEINGLSTTRSTNNFSINGVDITLNARSSASPSIITTSTDTNSIVDKLKSFINDYNDLISSLNEKVKEKRYRDYLPLTDDQRAAMKEDEIKNWEEKAKSGMLYNDSILKDAVAKLRMNLTEPVNVNGSSTILDSIGITTGQWFEGGKLVLKDEAKLREAIEKDPDKVIGLFTSRGTGTDAPKSEVGIFNRIYKDLKTTLDSFTERAGTSFVATSKDATLKDQSTLGRQLIKLNQDIKDKTRYFDDMETRYYKQFTAMEKAMNKFQSQSSSLFSSMGG
ncbi:flagellar filament capping protein FliD [Paenibacillus sp. RC67]|uniref:flagellar filament capping protein FliD n=1 Tax=Paenibacillus sp. RC67 TaxID=3039392 RepID=UPI0024ACE262|nr:flagellar filament capping protein FliD [Paenibacillus sp. RC67]